VSLRSRWLAYLLGTHVLGAGVAVVVCRRYPWALLPVEALFVLSFLIGWWLLRDVLDGLSVGGEAARLIASRELTTRMRETGDPHVDAMIGAYNRLVDSLRDERVRGQEQQYFLEHVIAASPSGIVIAGLDGRITAVNPAAERILEADRGALVGQPMRAAGALAAEVAGLPVGAASVVGLPGPRRIRGHHGAFMDRGFARSFFVFEELTDELRQFERSAYERLIRVMSHEVNNTAAASSSLLHSSLVYVADLAQPARDDARAAIEVVIGRTEALSAFMRRFADVYRLPRPERRHADLVDIVDPLVTLARAQAGTAGTTWQWTRPAGPVPVEVDRPLFERAILNILKNAGEAAGPSGIVTVRVAAGHGQAVLTVDDDGPGFSPEVQENLFTPFFSTKPDGQGIGLTLVQEILRAHGSEFRLERLSREARTRFTVVVR
jgi:signal transduction histidine kinase